MDQLPSTGAEVPAPVPARPKPRSRGSTWRLPLALILLCVVPMFGGSVRLIELANDVQVTPDNDHVLITTPIPIVVHIISACLYGVLGAFQFSAGLRHRHRGWHRAEGRVLVPLGLTAALSALWMTLFHPWPAGTGTLLYLFRLGFATAMALSLVLGFTAIRRRDIRHHRRWMTRAYAIGLGAGTQIFTLGFGEAIFGSAEVTHDLLMGAAWVINLAIAEWSLGTWRIRRSRTGAVQIAGLS